jgi:cell division septum initiation protein DivIVA
MDIQQRYENLLSDNKRLITEIDRLRQQLAEQTSAEPYAFEIEVEGLKRLHHTDGKTIPEFAPIVTVTKLYRSPQSVEVLVEALRSARYLLSAVDGISRNNFSQLASEEIQAIDKLISSYKPTEK